MTDPDGEKADPQISPDMPPRESSKDDDDREIEDPELRSGHIGTDDGPA